MLDWIMNLEPEFLILFGSSFVLIYFSLIVMRRAQKTLNLIGKRALTLTEELMNREQNNVIDIVIVNTSYVNVEAGAVGFIYKKINLPIKEESILVLARDSFKISIPIDELRTFVVGQSKVIKKIYVYAEDSLGRKTICYAKNATRRIKEIIKEEINSEKIEAKKQRFIEGKYLLGERFVLVLGVLFSPITNLSRSIKNGLNKRLKNREVRLGIKSIEKKHKNEMQLVFDEQRREEQILNVQKRLLEDKKIQESELKVADLKRKEELKKVLEEIKKIDAMIKKDSDDKARIEKEIDNKNKEINDKKLKINNEIVEKNTNLVTENVEKTEEKEAEITEKPVKKATKTSKKSAVETEKTEEK